MIITAGKYKGRKITCPNEKITRPTLSKVRMGVFNTLFSIIGEFEGKTFIDVFGGSGAMGIEAISRGFKDVLVIEKHPQAAKIITRNYNSLGLKPNIRIGDSLKILPQITTQFDVAYVDPPYESGIYEHILQVINAKIIILEHSEHIEIVGFEILKEKDYGGKKITFLKNT